MDTRPTQQADLHVRAISFADNDWLDAEGDGSHLTAILVINGTFHHLDAIRVTDDEDGVQKPSADHLASTLDGMYAIGADGPFDTVVIRGETYVLVATPFQ